MSSENRPRCWVIVQCPHPACEGRATADAYLGPVKCFGGKTQPVHPPLAMVPEVLCPLPPLEIYAAQDTIRG